MRTGSLVRGALIAAPIATLIAASSQGSALADPLGTWLTESGKSHVTIAPCGEDKLCGEIVWLREPYDEDGAPKLDKRNDDESLRDRPIIGIRVLWDLEDEGDGEWGDGEIYNPEDGESYDAEIEVVDRDTLKVSGCFFFICKTQTWKRAE